MENPWYIYVLIDPRNDAIRYVGATIYPRQRLATHMSNAMKVKSYVHRWITSLVRLGMKPRMKIIQKGTGLEWPAAERAWISHYRKVGARLTNLTDGGDGSRGYRHDEKALSKMRGRVMTSMARQHLRELNTGCSHGPHSEESRKRIGDGNRGKIVSLETREKLRRANLGKRLSAETIEKIRQANTGKQQPPEAIARTRAAHLGSRRSPETCRRISVALRGKNTGPRTQEVKDKISQSLLGRVFTSETRRRMSDSQQRRWNRQHSAGTEPAP